MVSHSSWYRVLLALLLSERASFCKPCFSSCRLAEDSRAANTQDYCLCMAKDGGDFIASWAFYIHEIGIGALHQALLLVFPLLLFWRGMKKILCERHVLVRRSSPPEKAHTLFYYEKLEIYTKVEKLFNEASRSIIPEGSLVPSFQSVHHPLPRISP